jgi:hypothetical protein
MAQQRINYYGRIRPANIDDLSVQRVQAVAGVIQDVADIGLAIATEKQMKKAETQAEAAAAEALETGIAPEEKDRAFSAISAYDQTYNEVLKKAYLAGAETQVREKINALAVEFPDDYQTFNTKVTGLRNGVLEGLPEEYRPAMQLQMDSLIGAQRSRVLAAEKTRRLTEADEQLILSSNDAVDNAITSLQNNDTLQAVQSIEQANQYIDDRVTANAITPAAGEVLKRENTFKLRVGTARATLTNILDSGQPGAFTTGINYVGSLQTAPEFADLTQVERDALIKTVRSDLSSRLTLDNQEQARLDELRQQSQDQTYFATAAAIIDGTADASTVLQLAQNRSISESQFDKLNNQLSTTGTGFDNWDIVFNIQNLMATDPYKARQEVVNNFGTNLTQRTASQLLKTIDGSGPLSTDRAKTYLKFLKANLGQVDAITGKFTGAGTKELASRALLQYELRVTAGEDPGIVAKSLFDISDIQGVGSVADADNQIATLKTQGKNKVQEIMNSQRISSQDAIQKYQASDDGQADLKRLQYLTQTRGRLQAFEQMTAYYESQLQTVRTEQEVIDNG